MKTTNAMSLLGQTKSSGTTCTCTKQQQLSYCHVKHSNKKIHPNPFQQQQQTQTQKPVIIAQHHVAIEDRDHIEGGRKKRKRKKSRQDQ